MKRFDLNNLSPVQKKAAIVLACCVLAVVITLSVTVVMVGGREDTVTTEDEEEYTSPSVGAMRGRYAATSATATPAATQTAHRMPISHQFGSLLCFAISIPP